MPKVSFLIATYNRINFLIDCIDSILSQSYKNLEVIVLDDCSTDSTEKVIKEKCGDRVIYHKNDFNRGVAFTRNKALTYASGEYIGLLDSDDILLTPSFLETALKIVESENADIFCCDNYRIDKKNQKIGNETFFQVTIDHRNIKLSSGIKDFDYIFFHGTHSCGMLIRKGIIDKTGFLDTSYKIAWDEDLFLRIAANPEFRIYYYNEPLAGYRIHGNNLSGNLSIAYREKIKCRKSIINKNKEIKKRLGFRINKRFASQYYCLADGYKREGKILHSFFALIKLFFVYPNAVADFFKNRKNLALSLYEV